MKNAEFILELGRAILHPSNKLIIPPPVLNTGLGLARAKVAVDFFKRKDLVLRALFEDWDVQRIIKELY